MANLVRSVGYSLGKLHTGLLCYLCDLWNDGEKEPFYCLWGGLGIHLQPRRLLPKREKMGIDLVVFDGDETMPLLVIETKVDDHEHLAPDPTGGKMAREYQTRVYPKLLPRCPHFIFLTLGVGEFYHPPYGNHFRWVRLEEFHRALTAIRSEDKVIIDWQTAIAHEVELRRRVLTNDSGKSGEYRAGAWNLTLLGDLKERLRTRIGADSNWDAKVYMVGTAPDTILNFGWQAYPLFMEINNNGKLNLKVLLKDPAIAQKLEGRLSDIADFWATRLPQPAALVLRKRHGGTRRLLSFDIGVVPTPRLCYRSDPEDTVRQVAAIQEAFHDRVNQEAFTSTFLAPS